MIKYQHTGSHTTGL